MDLKTPDLKVSGGIAITPSAHNGVSGTEGVHVTTAGPGTSIEFGVTPTVGISATVTANAEATILPSQCIPVNVAHGGTTEVPISKIQLTGPLAYGAYRGVFISVKGVLGPITVTPYIKLHVTTENGEGIITAYGNIVTA